MSTSPEHNSMEEPNVDVEEVVRKVLTAEEQKKLRQTNNITAWNKLVEHYGSEREARNAINTFTQGKQNLIQLVDELGAADPEVCFTTISKSVAKRDDTPNLPGVENTQPATARVGSGEFTATKWRELRKKDPKEYERMRPVVAGLVAKYGDAWFNT